MSAQSQTSKTPPPVMNVFDKMLLERQLASMSSCLIIQAGEGELHITDQDTIAEIKAVIERRAASWN